MGRFTAVFSVVFQIPTFDDVDILGRDPLNLDISDLLYYHEGMREARNSNVHCRVMRTDFLHCTSDEDFLAKLWCIRNAMNVRIH